MSSLASKCINSFSPPSPSTVRDVSMVEKKEKHEKGAKECNFPAEAENF